MNGPLVALNRLSVGAMENWGLITCRENALIVDPQDASPSMLRKVPVRFIYHLSGDIGLNPQPEIRITK